MDDSMDDTFVLSSEDEDESILYWDLVLHLRILEANASLQKGGEVRCGQTTVLPSDCVDGPCLNGSDCCSGRCVEDHGQ